MKQEIKVKWLEALRSGEYAQARHKLRTKDGYCCLGVLCDVYRKETGLLEWVEDTTCFKIKDRFSTTCLNDDVIEWGNLKVSNPGVIIDNELTTLAQLNDNGYSFNDIADVIEKEL
jgi:hypothetical protein